MCSRLSLPVGNEEHQNNLLLSVLPMHTGEETIREFRNHLTCFLQCNFLRVTLTCRASCMHVKLCTLFADVLDVAVFKIGRELFCSNAGILSTTFT